MIGYYLLSTNVCMSLFKFIAFEKQEESAHYTDTRRSKYQKWRESSIRLHGMYIDTIHLNKSLKKEEDIHFFFW